MARAPAQAHALKRRRRRRSWASSNLAVRWKHNPDRVIQLPEAFHQDDLLDQPANYLQICLVRARKLKVMDKSRLTSGGSSDPLGPLLARRRVCNKYDKEEEPEARLGRVLRATY